MFAAKPSVAAAMQELIDHFGFTYFQYLRCYRSGAFGLLTNDTRLTEYYVDNMQDSPAIYSSFSDDSSQYHSYWCLWDEEFAELPVSIARSIGICNGLTLIRRHKDYYDMIAVALPAPIANQGSFYLNKRKNIEQFITKFNKNEKELISTMDKNAISLAQGQRDVNYEKLCLASGRLKVKGSNGALSYITTQEIACIRLFGQGFSYKEIAQIAGLSPRSVETYLARAKERTGLNLGQLSLIICQ